MYTLLYQHQSQIVPSVQVSQYIYSKFTVNLQYIYSKFIVYLYILPYQDQSHIVYHTHSLYQVRVNHNISQRDQQWLWRNSLIITWQTCIWAYGVRAGMGTRPKYVWLWNWWNLDQCCVSTCTCMESRPRCVWVWDHDKLWPTMDSRTGITCNIPVYNCTFSSCSFEISGHTMVEWEQGRSSSNLCSHVTNGSHTSTRNGLGPRTMIFYNSTCSPGHCQEVSYLENNI